MRLGVLEYDDLFDSFYLARRLFFSGLLEGLDKNCFYSSTASQSVTISHQAVLCSSARQGAHLSVSSVKTR